MGGPSKEQIRLELQGHPPVATQSVIPPAVDTMGVLNVVDVDNTASGTTSRTKTSTA